MDTTLRAADLRLRRRHPRRSPAQGDHPRRVVDHRVLLPDKLDTPGRASTAGRRRHDARLGRHHRDGRDHQHGLGGQEPDPLLQARVVRQVHAVPRRRRLALQDPRQDRARRRRAARRRPAAERVRQHRRQDAVPVRRRRDRAGAQHHPALPRTSTRPTSRRARRPCRATSARPNPSARTNEKSPCRRISPDLVFQLVLIHRRLLRAADLGGGARLLRAQDLRPSRSSASGPYRVGRSGSSSRSPTSSS